MNLREGNIKALVGRCRDSKDMLPVPKGDADVIAKLQRDNRKCLVHIESHINDRARLEHSHWATSGD
jgi:hypothetical protein